MLRPQPLLSSLPIAAGLIAIIALVPAAVAQDAEPLDRIDLPAGWQPEGITSLGQTLFVGSLADGAIWRADSTTGEGTLLVPGSEARSRSVSRVTKPRAVSGSLEVGPGRSVPTMPRPASCLPRGAWTLAS